MEREVFIEQLKADFEKGFAERYGQVVFDDGTYVLALDLGLDADPRVAFRASYALEWAFFKDPKRFVPYIPQLLDNYLWVSNRSAQRHYNKILAYLMKHNMLSLSSAEKESIAERAFDQMIDSETPVAIKAWNMDILEMLSDEFPWIGEQLYETIQHLMIEGTPGFINRGTKVCRRIREKTQNTTITTKRRK